MAPCSCKHWEQHCAAVCVLQRSIRNKSLISGLQLVGYECVPAVCAAWSSGPLSCPMLSRQQDWLASSRKPRDKADNKEQQLNRIMPFSQDPVLQDMSYQPVHEEDQRGLHRVPEARFCTSVPRRTSFASLTGQHNPRFDLSVGLVCLARQLHLHCRKKSCLHFEKLIS